MHSSKREALANQLDFALRELNTSTVLVVSVVAEKVGIGPNDFRCAEILVRKGPMTAGDLAKETRLTSGAITGVIDRLEKAGWARRGNDPHDRRRVVVYPGPQDNPKTPADLYEFYKEDMRNLLSGYDAEQLTMILGFIRRLVTINHKNAGMPPNRQQR